MRRILVFILFLAALMQCEEMVKVEHTGALRYKLIFPKCDHKPITIVVIDTGFGVGWDGEESARLCKFGHKSFSSDRSESYKFDTYDPVPVDHHGHGTNIVGIIDGYAKRSALNYCIVVVKYFDPKKWSDNTVWNTTQAINYARQIGAKYINFSGGGVEYSKEEAEAVKKYLDSGGRFIAAAGNERSNMDHHKYYPAQADPRVIVVGNGKDQDHRCDSSNWGTRINYWVDAVNVPAYGYAMTGTSQAAAIVTGWLVAKENESCNK